MRQSILKLVTLVGVVASFAPYSFAGTITQTVSGGFPANITGNLPDQGSVLLETFTLPSSSNLTVTTNSYAAGGFEPNLELFNSLGNFITAGEPFGSVDPGTGIVGDVRLAALNLPAGMYTLAITDFLLNQSITATNLSDGFTDNSGSGTTFMDANGNQRNGNVAFTINAGAAAVPEPATSWLAAAFLTALVLVVRKRPVRTIAA